MRIRKNKTTKVFAPEVNYINNLDIKIIIQDTLINLDMLEFAYHKKHKETNKAIFSGGQYETQLMKDKLTKLLKKAEHA